MTVYNDTISEDITNNDLMYAFWPTLIGDGVSLSEDYHIAITMFVYEDVESSLTSIDKHIWRIIETIHMDEILVTAAQFHMFPEDRFVMMDLARIAWNSIIAEDLTSSLSSTDIIERFNHLREIINALDTSSTKHTATVALALAITLADFSGEITPLTDGITLDDTLIEKLKLALQVVEDMQLQSLLAEYVTFFQLTNDELSLDDDIISSASMANNLSDDMIFYISAQVGSDTYSGWVINPENYAVSQYSNYSFTGNTYYNRANLYCNSSGLYAVGGTLDESSYITSRIKTSVMSFGSSSLKQIPEALLGVNNTGEVILAISTDGSHTAYYHLKPASQGLSTQQIKIGKGLYGRYWQFELITKNNSTFDLDTFEFLPIVFGRKIGK